MGRWCVLGCLPLAWLGGCSGALKTEPAADADVVEEDAADATDSPSTCLLLPIECMDGGPDVEDAGSEPDVDARHDADAPPCPPPEEVRKDGACAPSFLSCPSVENKIPACVGGYEPTTCHCLSKQWSCEVYGIPCPDARPEASDAFAEASDDAPDEGTP
jgi:hypothetical protein